MNGLYQNDRGGIAMLGALLALGLIVGGWKDSESEGHYGIRVWLKPADAVRMGIDPSDIESRPNQDPTIPYPALPARMDGERRLTPRERAALVLRDMEDLPAEEVARRLDCSRATVRSHIANARVKLKKFAERRKQ